MKLVPLSEYVALARESEDKVILKYYGKLYNKKDRLLATGLKHIIQIETGKKEKLLYVVDSQENVLAQYLLPEIGCPRSPEVISCSPLFIEK